MLNIKELYQKTIVNELKKEFKYKNIMEVPKLEKVVLSRGLGEATNNSKAIEISVDVFKAITGQKVIATKSKKAISNFKLRENQVIGCKVTLRNKKMYDFLTKFINLALPKIRDFQGVSAKSFDGRGNYTLGIKEEIIFPEVNFDKLDRIRGMNITFITTAKTDKEAYHFLKLLGLPFKEKI
ncbi:50S ribosomal protein L5 [Candidatus Margulisiibacteriota bacterium]